jgi:HlyD family secretion protein
LKSTNWDDDNTVLEVRNDVVDLGDQEERLVDYDAIQTNVVTSAILDERTDRTPIPMRPAPHAQLFPDNRPSPQQLFPDNPPLRRSSTPIPVQRTDRPSVPMMARTASPTPSAPVIDPELHARVASLSLDKGPDAATSAAGGRRGSSKLPWVLLLGVVAGGGLYHYTTLRDLKQAPAPAVAAPAGSGKAAASAPTGSLLASGYIAAKTPIVISATASGRLQEVRVDSGDTLQKGQIIAIIDDTSIRAELGLAGARVRDAQRAYKRQRMLASAQAATPVDVERAMGAVEVAGAEYRVIQQKLDDMRIKSPINGTVLEVIAHPGETLTAGPSQSAAILKIADLSALVAEVDVAEAELKNVRLNQAAEVTSEAQHNRRYRGIVREIAEQADRARGTVLVKVDIGALIEDESATPKATPGSAGSAAGSAGSAAGSAGSAAGSAAPAPGAGSAAEAVLKPGMAIQVRFLAQTAEAASTVHAPPPAAPGSAPAPPAAASPAAPPAATPATTPAPTPPAKPTKRRRGR